MVAVGKCQPEMVRELLARPHIDLGLVNAEGRDALDIARDQVEFYEIRNLDFMLQKPKECLQMLEERDYGLSM